MCDVSYIDEIKAVRYIRDIVLNTWFGDLLMIMEI